MRTLSTPCSPTSKGGTKKSRSLTAQGALCPQEAWLDDELIKQPHSASGAGRAVLAVGKALYVIGTFAAFHLLRRTQMTPLEFLAVTFTVAAAALCAVHRPWRLAKGRQLNLQGLLLCWKTSLCTALVHWLLVFGLGACAPVRFLILEHLEVLVTYCLGMLLGAKQVQGPKVQGGLLIFAGYLVCLWHDTTPVRAGASIGAGIVSLVPVDEVDETNTYDSFVGTLAIGLASFVAVTARRSERQLCTQLGSLKRVHALQAAMALTVLWPLAALQRLFAWELAAAGVSSVPGGTPSAFYMYPMIVFVAVAFVALRFALQSMQEHFRVQDGQAMRTSVVIVTVIALGVHSLHSWDTLLAPAIGAIEDGVPTTGAIGASGSNNVTWEPQLGTIPSATGQDQEDASSALAVYVAAALVCSGVFRFTGEGGETQLSRLLAQRVLPLFELGGPNRFMLPLREDKDGSRQNGPAGRLVRLTRQLWRQRSTRRPLGYLGVCLTFAALELIYGRFVGSTDLVSDAKLVLVDGLAAGVALAAAHFSTRPPSGTWTYGGARAEVLGGFVNGLLLVVAVCSQLVGAMRRAHPAFGLKAPPSERLLIVHVLGLAINACGLALFHESFGAQGLAHIPLAKRSNPNTRGLFLHVLADVLCTLVLVSSSLARHYGGWTVLDPLASLLVAGALLYLVLPLLRSTAVVLLQRQPPELDEALVQTLARVRALGVVPAVKADGLASQPHFWCVTPRHEAEGSLQLAVRPDLPPERWDALRGEVADLFRPFEVRVVVQLEAATVAQCAAEAATAAQCAAELGARPAAFV